MLPFDFQLASANIYHYPYVSTFPPSTVDYKPDYFTEAARRVGARLVTMSESIA